MRRRFVCELTIDIHVEFDDDLMPDEEWRSVFYPIHTIKDLAEHLAWNFGINNARLSDLDGFADRPDSDAGYFGCEVVEWGNTRETADA